MQSSWLRRAWTDMDAPCLVVSGRGAFAFQKQNLQFTKRAKKAILYLNMQNRR